MIEVKTGIQDDSYITVTSGLEGGEEIVVGPYSAISKKLESGKEINKKDEKDKKELATTEQNSHWSVSHQSLTKRIMTQ